VPVPEQHRLGVLVSVPAARHRHIPFVHTPDWQSPLPAHGLPFGLAPQVPSAQTLEVQSEAAVHGVPSGFVPQVPSAQAPEAQASALGHGVPSGCFAVHVPALQ
jgi:hypothetical protein